VKPGGRYPDRGIGSRVNVYATATTTTTTTSTSAATTTSPNI